VTTRQFGPAVGERAPGVVPLVPGDVLANRYRIEKPLAAGGMGVVWEAKDTTLDRPVAVKVLQESWAREPDFAERFEREARAASRINHPNCIVVHDFGKSEKGLYLVMEWIAGRPLSAILGAEGALQPERAAALMLQICAGLAAAHAAGIIHRDVKPQNVMVVVPEGGAETAKLIDFGIARLPAKEAAPLTQAGLSIGSPDFMSPEQALGETCDARSDVYSATGVLYAMLTGSRPYVAESGVDVMQKHLNGPVPTLRAQGARLEGFESVIARGMAKSPGARFPGAKELAEAVRAASGGGATLASPVRRAPWVPTLRQARIAGGALVALVLLFGVIRLASTPHYPDVDKALASSDFQAALDRIEVLEREHPSEPHLGLLRGHALAGMHERFKARAAYTEALKTAPGLASDPTLLTNAASWLDEDSDDAVAFWRDAIGSAGLPTLRKATASESHQTRANAVRLREALKDPEPVDYLAVATADVLKPDSCTTRASAAKRLQALGDKRAIPALREAKKDMGLLDRICIGSAVDDALRALGAPPEE
jgi:serine/threonine protein kinase